MWSHRFSQMKVGGKDIPFCEKKLFIFDFDQTDTKNNRFAEFFCLYGKYVSTCKQISNLAKNYAKTKNFNRR